LAPALLRVFRGRKNSGNSVDGVGAGVSIAAEAAARRSRHDGVDSDEPVESVELDAASSAADLALADVRLVVERDEAGFATGLAPLDEPESPGSDASVDWKPLSRSSIDRPPDGAEAPGRADEPLPNRDVDGRSGPGSDNAANVDANVANASSTGCDEPLGPVCAEPSTP